MIVYVVVDGGGTAPGVVLEGLPGAGLELELWLSFPSPSVG